MKTLTKDKTSYKVLTIDDEDPVRLSISAFLEDYNYEVLEAVNGKIGLEIFNKERPDLVLVDLRMPEMDGLEVLEKIIKKSPDTPIIVVSGAGIISDIIEALHLGAWDYLLKPLTDMEVLYHSVEKALERARLINENRKYRKHLEDEVEKRTKELEDSNTKLIQSQKMEAIGTLAGGIAHDFNNILAAIMGNAELLQMKIPPENPEQKNIANILSASYRARDLVMHILTYSRKDKLVQKPIHIHLIIKEALKLLTASLPSTIEIRKNIKVSSYWVMANITQIHQVVMNLCTNAHHAMLKKGGILEVTLSEINSIIPEYSNLPEGPWIKLSISDTGHGMTPETIERIFDPYFTTKEIDVGTGLGLSVVHGIVKNNGGIIQVESEPGKGSTFHIFFPGVEKKKYQKTAKFESLLKGNNEQILFVDDEEILIDIGKHTLESLGYKTVTSINPEEALKIFQDKPNAFDLVITDMTMPKMTGDILAGEILKIRPDMPIILTSGYNEFISEEKANVLGIKAFIMKPFQIDQLSETIQKLLHE